MNRRDYRSNCCQAPVHASGDDGSRIHVCNKCQNPCDLYYQTPDKLNEELRERLNSILVDHNNQLTNEHRGFPIETLNYFTANRITTAYAEAMNEVIGEDEYSIDPIWAGQRGYWARNELRAEQRQRLKGLLPNGKDE